MVRYPCDDDLFLVRLFISKVLFLLKLTIVAINIGTDGLWLWYIRMRPPITSRRLQALCSSTNVWSFNGCRATEIDSWPKSTQKIRRYIHWNRLPVFHPMPHAVSFPCELAVSEIFNRSWQNLLFG